MIAIRLHPAARRELHRAVDWYIQEASQQVAAGLLEDFEHLLSLIQSHPKIGTAGNNGVRKLTFKRYPYTLVYRLNGERVEILACAHYSRYPEYWTGRL